MAPTTVATTYCPAGHDQTPIRGPPVSAVAPDGSIVQAQSIVSGPRVDRPGRCHRCGAPLGRSN